MKLKSGKSGEVKFQFSVPSMVPDGSYICTETLFGQDKKQRYFNTLASTSFCVEKGVTGFSVVPKKEAEEMLREHNRVLKGERYPRHA